MSNEEFKYFNKPASELTKVQSLAAQVAAGLGLYYLKNRPKQAAMEEIAEVAVEIAENIILITTQDENE